MLHRRPSLILVVYGYFCSLWSAVLLVGLASACSAAAQPPVVSNQRPMTCESIVADDPKTFAGLFRSDFLYTCHLEKAFNEYVALRRGCERDQDCAFVPGECGIHGAPIHRKYLAQVTAVRDLVVTAYHKAAVCSEPKSALGYGGFATSPRSRCVDNRCE